MRSSIARTLLQASSDKLNISWFRFAESSSFCRYKAAVGKAAWICGGLAGCLLSEPLKGKRGLDSVHYSTVKFHEDVMRVVNRIDPFLSQRFCLFLMEMTLRYNILRMQGLLPLRSLAWSYSWPKSDHLLLDNHKQLMSSHLTLKTRKCVLNIIDCIEMSA